MAVLERAGEERAHAGRIRQRLELPPLGAEADDHGARLDVAERAEQHVDALLLDELAEVDDGRLLSGEERPDAGGVVVIRATFVGVPGVRPVERRLVEKLRQRLIAAGGLPEIDVDPRRNLEDALGVAADVVDHRPDVRGADERRPRVGERLRAPRSEIGPAAHRVLELRPVRLDRERAARREPHGTAEEHVVREHEIGGQQLANGCGVCLDPALELGASAVGETADVGVTVVPVEHEDGKEALDVRADGCRPPEVERLGVRLLAQDGDVVAGACPLAGELPRVDVGAGAAEQVSVPEQDAHGAHPAARGSPGT
jgi:hypothetical protein